MKHSPRSEIETLFSFNRRRLSAGHVRIQQALQYTSKAETRLESISN